MLYPFYILTMCGDIMITTKNKNKTNNWSSALVISIMCAVIMTIIRQSINNHTDTYAWILHNNEIWSQEIHSVASDTTPSVQWSRTIFDDITSLITDQKQLIDNYLWWKKDSTVISSLQTWTTLISWSVQPVSPPVSEYMSFEQLKKTLADKNCEYSLPIDNTDPKIAPHIQWWLQHCLITVSAAQKVYPNDILTHEMMRVIAQRAWFDVKMEYASSKPVLRDQFLTFFYALQQHHQIGDLPVVSMSTPLKRSEYILFLHTIFWDTIQKIISLTGSLWTGTVSVVTPRGSDLWPSMTVKEFKQMLISQGQPVTITAYDDTIMITPDIMQKILSEVWEHTPSLSSSVGIDKEMMKQTLSWFIEKL